MEKAEFQQEINSHVWEGAVPLSFTLDPADSMHLTFTASLPAPFNTFYASHRNGYFPYILQKLKNDWLVPLLVFESHKPQLTRDDSKGIEGDDGIDSELNLKEFWIEYEGYALKWQSRNNNLEALNTEPWHLILHTRNYPSEKLLRGPTVPQFEKMFLSLLKETDFVRNGSSKKVMDLAKSEQVALLEGLKAMNPSFFQAINRLCGYSVVNWAAFPELDCPVHISKLPQTVPKAVPVRFYILKPLNLPPFDNSDPYQVIQAPVSVYYLSQKNASDKQTEHSEFWWTSLRTAVYSMLSSHSLAPSTYLDCEMDIESTKKIKVLLEGWECLIHGVSPMWQTPLLWLAENLSYPDGFLHIILIQKNTNST
ncbi:hypothetical protein BB560_000374 [Smittium megazygosporum]|uniref:Autophagy protein 5 n=1 Tax=Smittium megazygosporum TaxID=133381 RepID=A0A2T9ZKJ1_9FUNG|nr:hypothetical protein BB560_000371 [Smittium megazygosporum]PVV05111.1 hypothetical protein BB560_000374 [Smittium megazygosporum]